MSALTLKNIVKSYDGKIRAVDGVSLAIEKGEFVTFLGPSGSGKTTTLMMIAGFERPTSGTITLAGRPIDPVPPHRRNIGMVFQNYALFPNMSVARNVGYPLRMRGVAKAQIRDKVGAMLRIVGLSAFAGAEPRNLSGGQQQRVALARALVFEPDVLLLDEPLGALDKNLREQMQIEIRRIHRELGVTTVYVTHDQTEAMTMSDRIAVFNAGRIEQVATPLEIYGRPQTVFVAGFIGDNNIFPATRDAAGSAGYTVEGLGVVRAAGDAPGGSAHHISVRPESIRLAKSPEGAPNRFALAVTSLLNYGDSVVVFGRVGTHDIKMRLSAADAAGLAEGQHVKVEWDPSSVHVI
jgi:putative spermidine/putrescine transport system ATP-binding protein